jgi:D-alanyl-lipoteichoic acid acyltransferase DltB (MBOAT superfamily)
VAFDLGAIFVFGIAGLLFASLLRARWRAWSLLAGCVVAVYWLQPALPIRFSDYILPTLTIGLAVVGWWFTRRPDDPAQAATLREDGVTLAFIAALVVGLSFMRFVEADFRLTASRPPEPLVVAGVLAAAGVPIALSARRLPARVRPRALTVAILAIVALFVVLKAGPLAVEASRVWRGLAGQDTSLANSADLNWLGFSYVAFRLIHTLRDRQTGILPALSLREYVTYAIFFPSLTAGPIDRAERFAQDLRGLPGLIGLDAARIAGGLARIAIGLFKKFVLADSLAQGMALNAVNAAQVTSTPGLWLLLYGYGLRLYFDFAGYTDIALGMGILFGIRLPENFDRPYLKTSLTAFWQSWHMTLSRWARFYVFTPLSRWLLTRAAKPSPTLIVLAAQLATMAVIGLWHGIAPNFLAWGMWHAIGLFAHKQWSDRTRRWYRSLGNHPARKRAWSAFTWFITFHYVVVGWVWFVLPDVGQAASSLAKLFGAGW